MNSCTFRSGNTPATGVRSIVSKDRVLWRRCLAATIAVVCLATDRAWASNVQLNLTTSDPTQTSGTWAVTATLSDNQSLGLVGFEIDVLGSPGVTILRAANALQTLQVSNPPYSLFRAIGTLSAPDLTQIYASQDTITAASSINPSILRFGDGLPVDAVSSVYGTIAHGGPLTLAMGRWTASGTGGTIRAIETPEPNPVFSLLPLNFAVDDGTGQLNPPPAGTVQHTIFPSNVFASNIVPITPVPEPASFVLAVIGGAFWLGHRAWRRLRIGARIGGIFC